jgi:hypothetical protein
MDSAPGGQVVDEVRRPVDRVDQPLEPDVPDRSAPSSPTMASSGRARRGLDDGRLGGTVEAVTSSVALDFVSPAEIAGRPVSPSARANAAVRPRRERRGEVASRDRRRRRRRVRSSGACPARSRSSDLAPLAHGAQPSTATTPCRAGDSTAPTRSPEPLRDRRSRRALDRDERVADEPAGETAEQDRRERDARASSGKGARRGADRGCPARAEATEAPDRVSDPGRMADDGCTWA